MTRAPLDAEMKGRLVKLAVIDAVLIGAGVALYLATGAVAVIVAVAVLSLLAGALLVVAPALSGRARKARD